VIRASLALALVACKSNEPPERIDPASIIVVHVDAPVPMAVYKPAAAQLQTDAIAPKKLTWDGRLVDKRQLDKLLGEWKIEAIGKLIVIEDRVDVRKFDDASKTVEIIFNGLAGIDDIDTTISLAANPTVTRGEMPMGGHAKLDIGYIHAKLTTDATTAETLAKHHLVQHMMLTLSSKGEVDGADVIFGKLEGVRIVDEDTHETLLEGVSAH
jgi:hypothetical protein